MLLALQYMTMSLLAGLVTNMQVCEHLTDDSYIREKSANYRQRVYPINTPGCAETIGTCFRRYSYRISADQLYISHSRERVLETVSLLFLRLCTLQKQKVALNQLSCCFNAKQCAYKHIDYIGDSR